jgi:hypothetical protein
MDLFTDQLLSRWKSNGGARKERVRYEYDMKKSILIVWIKFIFEFLVVSFCLNLILMLPDKNSALFFCLFFEIQMIPKLTDKNH